MSNVIPFPINRAISRDIARQSRRNPAPGKPLEAPPVFLFEPHQPEQCDWKPQVLVDVTPVWEIKHKSMESMEAQTHLWEYYTDLGKRRGVQAVRNGGLKTIKYAEAFQRVYPQVTTELT